MAQILTIDDDKAMLALIKNALSKDGHTVTCICQVTETLQDNLSPYDLILLDIMMPGTDGYTFCREIRRYTDCPILFLTAKSLEEDVAFGFSVGADDYIKKPFSILELRARVNAHLRRDQREKVQCFCVGSVRFFLIKKEIWADGEKLSFTKSEYEISLLLAKNHGQIYSKEQIFENVFGYDKESDISAITEHIKNIRKKLAAAGLSPIETIWGIGYRWNGM
ncbi:MAG: response regulator transcription factor [Lachnospiraceae bacterium]|nr:response regulator transcription factor [Lachnospiraceae bacterium]